MADDAERIRYHVRRRREELGLNQRQLAERMSVAVSNQHVSNWERGIHIPSTRYQDELAEALDVDPAYFHQPLPDETPDLVGNLNGAPTEFDQIMAAMGEMAKQLEELSRKLD